MGILSEKVKLIRYTACLPVSALEAVMMKALKGIIWVLILTVILLGVPKLSGMIASLFDYKSIDPDGAYAWITVHHIVQALIFIIIIIIIIIIIVINRFKPLQYGFGRGDKEVGRKYVLSFTLIFAVGCSNPFIAEKESGLSGNLYMFNV